MNHSVCCTYSILYTKGMHDRVSYAAMIFIPLQFESNSSVRVDDTSRSRYSVILHILVYNTHWAQKFCRSLLIRQFNWCFRNENKNTYFIYNIIYTYYCKCGILPILLNHICSSLYFVFNARLVSNEI